MKNLILKELRWSNAFSYGKDNVLKLDENKITQVVGDNGAGKTSLIMLITEALFSKNLRNIKKDSISNDNTDDKGYHVELDFTDGVSEYTIIVDRKTSLKLQLLKDGEDISEHRSPDTYKKIDEIFGGLGFKTFLPLIYQSTQVVLDFLKSTDKSRKDFLLSLLQQEKYRDLYEHFRLELTAVKKQLSKVEGKASVHQEWLDKYEDFDFSSIDLEDEAELEQEIADLTKDLNEVLENIKNLSSKNREINKNNSLKEELDKLETTSWPADQPSDMDKYDEYKEELSKLKSEIDELEVELKANTQNFRKIDTELSKFKKGVCPTCGQEVEKEHLESESNRLKDVIDTLKGSIKDKKALLQPIAESIKDIEAHKKALEIAQKQEEAYVEKQAWLLKSINTELQEDILDINDLEYQKKDIQSEINTRQTELKRVKTHNKKAQEHNSKIQYISEQFAETEKKLDTVLKEVAYYEEQVNLLTIIKDAFGNKGLVTYKIESSIKHLEKEINSYLSKISNYQMYFFNQQDKLMIKVIDSEDNELDIDRFSSGELGRINIATLLGIRKMMSEISGVHINFLFLDEIVSVLDDEGKETLADIMLNEKGLNTFMVAHGTDIHPLASKVFIKKENKISKVLDGR